MDVIEHWELVKSINRIHYGFEQEYVEPDDDLDELDEEESNYWDHGEEMII